jgi:DNA-binding NarL/FixJ family response regulator
VNTLSLGCGSQDNLHLQSTKKNGADVAPFFLSKQRDQESEIRQYLERRLNSDQIAQRLKLDPYTVDKYLSTLRSRL